MVARSGGSSGGQMIDLKQDNRNLYFCPSVSYVLDNEPITDAVITVTLGSKVESGVIQGASEDSDIVIDSMTPHGLSDGDFVVVCQVVGNKGANGVFEVEEVDSTHFRLLASTPTGPYKSGGVWFKAIPGIINLSLSLVNESLYAGVASEDVNLELGVDYLTVLDIDNYGVHLEENTRVSVRTG